MTSLTLHMVESAPEESKPILKGVQNSYGRVPNLFGVLASAPAALEGALTLNDLFATKTSFNAEEKTVVWQTINVESDCHYCVPAHTVVAHSMEVDSALNEALRNGDPMPNKKLQALQDLTLIIFRNRGRVTHAQLDVFYAAGYGEQQVLEIILGLAHKLMTNYTNHIADTPVDEVFSQFAWTKIK